jgi:hypothetical protein
MFTDEKLLVWYFGYDDNMIAKARCQKNSEKIRCAEMEKFTMKKKHLSNRKYGLYEFLS